jgi:hypothetical protein
MVDAAVDFEFEREERSVVLSVRAPEGNFILTLPLEGATVFAVSAQRVTDDDQHRRLRFQIGKAKLEVSSERSSTVQRRSQRY